MNGSFKDKRGIVHAVKQRFDHLCSFPAGMATLVGVCGKRVKHHNIDLNRLVNHDTDCMACVANSCEKETS